MSDKRALMESNSVLLEKMTSHPNIDFIPMALYMNTLISSTWLLALHIWISQS